MEAIGLFNFNSKEPDELSFYKGANIKILNIEEDPNWLRAELDNITGVIPANYVDVQPHNWYVPYCSRIEAENRLLEVDEITNQQIQPDGAFLIRQSLNSKGTFSLSVKNRKEIIHFRVLCNENYKFSIWTDAFPSLNKLIDYYSTHSVCKDDQPRLCLKNRVESKKFCQPSACGYFQAQFDFNGQSIEELSFKHGDIIKKVGEEDVNWWVGELKGRRGIFPSNYVQKMNQ